MIRVLIHIQCKFYYNKINDKNDGICRCNNNVIILVKDKKHIKDVAQKYLL